MESISCKPFLLELLRDTILLLLEFHMAIKAFFPNSQPVDWIFGGCGEDRKGVAALGLKG